MAVIVGKSGDHMTSLFAQIVPMFGQTEVAATAALRHILEQSGSARNALGRMLLASGVEVGSLTRFQTEAIGAEGARVDLVCYDEHGTERVLIEAKFWAGLTDNQPNTYLARLPADTPSVLLFVAPAQRIETLWPELCRRSEEQRTISVTSDAPNPGELRAASIEDTGHSMMLTSWRAVLERMEAQASLVGEQSAVRDIEQLRGLTERMDSEAFLPIHAHELGQDFPRRMLNLVSLVDDAGQRAIANGWATPARGGRVAQWYGDGRYLHLYGIEVWFGIDIRSWAVGGDSPIWVHSRDGRWSDPIYLPTGVEHAGVLNSVVEQLSEIGQNLKRLSGEQ